MSEYKPLRPGKNVSRESLLHPERAYVPADRTNIAATFARVRAELAASAKPSNVRKVRAA